jgi:hypothetical protein
MWSVSKATARGQRFTNQQFTHPTPKSSTNRFGPEMHSRATFDFQYIGLNTSGEWREVLEHGQVYVTAVCGVNAAQGGAGSSSCVYSDGVMVDATAPDMSGVDVFGGVPGSRNISSA